MDLLYPYVNNTRSTRIPVTKRKPENVYLRPNKTTTGKTFTSTESIPLSTLAKTTTNERNRTNISESSAFCSGKFSKGKIIKHSTKRNLELIVVNNMLEPDI